MESLTTPISVTSIKTIYYFTVQNVVVALNSYACINVALFDVSSNPIGNKSFVLDNPNYILWGSNDTYIVDYVKSQIPLIDSL
jgi:hypothetical protein